MGMQRLNQRAAQVAAQAAAHADSLRVRIVETDSGQLLDFGVDAEGGLAAGQLLARICLSGLADVALAPADRMLADVPQVCVRTDHAVESCLLSQYAGWKLATDDYFGMASGPMRALWRGEALFEDFEATEDGTLAVGVLESAALPTASAMQSIRESIPGTAALTLAVARTASQAGTLQVVARSVETAMHKLHAIEFPVATVVSAAGTAPLPPVAADDLVAIGRTNDAILYGGTVNLWVRTEDPVIESLGPRVPSSASESHGQTFLSLFEAAGHDFYALDAALFSPAVVVFHNLTTGHSFRFGRLTPELIGTSFGL